MQVFLDGFLVLQKHLVGVTVFWVSVLGMGVWLAHYVPIDEKHRALLVPFSLSAGVVALTLVSFVLVLLGHVWPQIWVPGSVLVVVWAVANIILRLWRNRMWSIRLSHMGIFILGLLAGLLLLIIRLAFMQGMLLPPYSDSAEHYMIVRDLLSPTGTQTASYSLGSIADRYYHFGFHSLTAWLVSVAGLDASMTMALLGQTFLVISPLAVMFFIGVTTEDGRAALFAALLAGAGWRMPAYAANWGKYPALAGVVTFPVILAVLYLCFRASNKKMAALTSAILLLMGAVLFHTRILICLFLAGLSFLLALVITARLKDRARIWAAIAITILAAAFSIRHLGLALMYWDRQWIALGALLVLLPFACIHFPRFSFGTALFALGLILASKAPLPDLLQISSPVLLDRPFLEISFYLPLSVLWGLGASGLLKKLSGKMLLARSVFVLLIALVFLNAGVVDSFYPDPCCDFVKRIDLYAIDWIADELPEDAVILISGYQVRDYLIGTDAGVWIRPLTGNQTRKKPYDFAWDSPDVLGEICQFGNVYVYAGGMYYSFDKSRLSKPEWYQPVFGSRGTKIYHVVACSAGN